MRVVRPSCCLLQQPERFVDVADNLAVLDYLFVGVEHAGEGVALENSVATCAGFEAHITATTVERVSLLLVLLDNVPLVNLRAVLVP